jgi:oligopeptide transport system ATP-binding protein
LRELEPGHKVACIHSRSDGDSMSEPLLSVRNLTKQFALKGGLFSRHINSVHAIDGVDFHVDRG